MSGSTDNRISKYLVHKSGYFYNTGAKYINPNLITFCDVYTWKTEYIISNNYYLN